MIDEFNDPDGRVQEFIQSQSDDAVRLSLAVVGVIFQVLSVLLFTFYLVADGPRLRRAICSPARHRRARRRVLQAWELAITKTGGYLYSRALLALLSTFFHWIVFQSIGTPAPIALALWVGLVSQFLPVVGTYLAGILPVLLTFVDSPLKALIVIVFIVVYQQIENYFFAPRITARTMELHPAVAFGAALAGAALLGFVGALLALPAAAMVQAFLGEWGNRYDVVDSHLTADPAAAKISARPMPAAGRAGTDVTRFDGAFAPIAVATRSGFDESLHHGAGRRTRRRRIARRVASVIRPWSCTRGRASSRCRRTRWSASASTLARRTARRGLRQPRRNADAPRCGARDPRPATASPSRDLQNTPAHGAVRSAGSDAVVAAAELLRQARRDARHLRRQRLADRRRTSTWTIRCRWRSRRHRRAADASCTTSASTAAAPRPMRSALDELAGAFAGWRSTDAPVGPRRCERTRSWSAARTSTSPCGCGRFPA